MMNRQWDWVTEPQGPPLPTSSIGALSPEDSTTFTNSATSWGLSVPTQCLKGTSHTQTMAVDINECIGVLGLVLKITHEILFSLNMNKAIS